MLTVDVNILIYAFRRQSPHHEPCLLWLEQASQRIARWPFATPF